MLTEKMVKSEAWQKLDRYDPRYSFTTWLYRIGTNLAIVDAGRQGDVGFYGVDRADELVLFGRGGSDDTACAMAAGLGILSIEFAWARRWLRRVKEESKKAAQKVKAKRKGGKEGSK